ncbi:MAG: hypothetical protein SF187_29900 [Deltaproteobacteria bacterium]|nr:hypothetical protein [Deltaproteobacteria bacterium]
MFKRSLVMMIALVATLQHVRHARANDAQPSPPSFAWLPAGAAAFGLGVYLNLSAAADFKDGNDDCAKLFTGCNTRSIGGGLLILGGQALMATYGWKLGTYGSSLNEEPPGALSKVALVFAAVGFTTSLVAGAYSVVKALGCTEGDDRHISSACAGDTLYKATLVQTVGQGVLFAAAPFAAYGFGYRVHERKKRELVLLPMSPAGGGMGLMAASAF